MSAGALDLGTLYSRLFVDYSDLAQAEREAIRFTSRTNAHVAKLSDGFKKTGKVLTATVTTSLIGAGIASAKFATDFDKGIREVNSLLGEADKDFEGLKEQVRGVSLALGTDLTDSAKSAYQAISAGVKKDNLVDFLTVASKSAIAGVTKTEVAVDGLTTVMNAWKASAGSVEDVADVMFMAVKNGKTTFEELSSSMFHAAGIAPELGVSFKEIAAATAQMTAQGVPTSVAMTQMRASMVALAKPNEEMEKLLKAAGITNVKTSIQTLGLVGTLSKLREESEKGKISLDKAMGGAEAMGLVYKATGSNVAGFQKNLADMESSTGSATAAFEELDKARGFDKLVNNLKSLATIIGDQLLPVISPMIQGLAGWLSQVNQLDPGLVKLGIVMGVVAAAMGPILLGIGTFLGAVLPAITAAGGLGAALAGLAAIAGPIGAVIVGIAGAAYLLYENWDTVSGFIKGIIDKIVGYFNTWKNNNSQLLADISSNWSAFITAAGEVWNTLYTMVSGAVVSVITSLNSMLAPIGGLQGAWNIFKEIVGIALTAVGENLKAFLTNATSVLTQIDAFVKSGGLSWEDFKNLVLLALKEAANALTGYVLTLGDFVNKIIAGLKQVPEAFRIIFEEVVTYLKSINWSQLGSDLMTGLKNGIISGGKAVVSGAKAAANAVTDGVKEAFDSHSPSRVFEGIGKDLMDGLGVGINRNTDQAVSQMVASANTLMNAAKEKLSSEQITSNFKSFESNMMLDSSIGGGQTNYQLEVQKEQAYYEQSLAMLEQAQALKIESISGYAKLREQIETKHKDNMISINREVFASTANALDQTLYSLEQFGGKQSKIYRAIFAASKAFAIAEAMLAIQQNIANAMKVGFPYNIPFIAGAVAQGAGIIANVQSIGAFNNGGYLATGQVGMVGEKGAEFITGPANVLSTQNTKELMNSGGGKTQAPTIIIQNLPGQTATVSKDKDNATIIRIAVDTAKREIAHEANNGGGVVVPAILKAGGQRRRA